MSKNTGGVKSVCGWALVGIKNRFIKETNPDLYEVYLKKKDAEELAGWFDEGTVKVIPVKISQREKE